MSEANDKWERGRIRAEMLGTVEKKTTFSAELKEAIQIWVGVRGESCYSFAINNGMKVKEAEELLWEAMTEKAKRERKIGFRLGQLSMMPPGPKSNVVRMPAPERLKRAA